MLSIRPLSDDLQRIAKDELNEVEIEIPEALEEIKRWLATQPHIKSRTDDQFLISFLRTNKYDLNKTKEHLESYWTFKTKCYKEFGSCSIDDPHIKAFLKTGYDFDFKVKISAFKSKTLLEYKAKTTHTTMPIRFKIHP
jgi:hypothetical protein